MNTMRQALILAFLALPCACEPAQAQLNPSRQITMVVPIGAGGGVDATGRLIAEKLQERLKQPVVVENRPAAGGMVGTDSVAKAAPDGHTLLLMESSAVLHKWLHTNVPYDVVADFAPIARVATSPLHAVRAAPRLRRTISRTDRAGEGRARQALRRHAGRRHAASSRPDDAQRARQDRHRQRAISRRGAVAQRCAGRANPDDLGGADRGDAACRHRQGQDPRRRLGAAAAVAAAGAHHRRERRAGLRSRDLVRRRRARQDAAGPGRAPCQEIAEIVALPDVQERIAQGRLEPAYLDGEKFRAQIRADHERFGKIIRDAGIAPN